VRVIYRKIRYLFFLPSFSQCSVFHILFNVNEMLLSSHHKQSAQTHPQSLIPYQLIFRRTILITYSPIHFVNAFAAVLSKIAEPCVSSCRVEHLRLSIKYNFFMSNTCNLFLDKSFQCLLAALCDWDKLLCSDKRERTSDKCFDEHQRQF